MFNIDSIKLQNINKPARYVGGEVNQIIKNNNIKNRVVLCYLNVYEKAMSNYYINLLYDNLNLIDDVWCKRCFAPDIDFEELLKNNNEEIYSLEDFKSIKESDILLFVIDNELDFTNFFNILKLANIELDKSKRTKSAPKILFLPINNTNVKTIEKYADYVFEFSEPKRSVQKVLKFFKDGGKEQLHNINNLIAEYSNVDIIHSEKSIIPSIKVNNSSIIIDFCFMGDRNEVIEYINKCVKSRGINKVSFLNYENINEYKFCEYVYKIKANIPNIRILCNNIDFNMFSKEALEVLLPCMEKNTAYFNVTTCSKKIRDKLNVGIDEELLLEKIKKVFKNDRNSITLKFNIGFPDETYEDIDNIFTLLDEIVKLYSKNKAKDKFGMRVYIDYYIPNNLDKMKNLISNFTKLETKVKYIMQKEVDYTIKLDIKDVESYVTRLMLVNADESLTKLIQDAYNLGARFNSDSKKYKKLAWEKALFDNMELINKFKNI